MHMYNGIGVGLLVLRPEKLNTNIMEKSQIL